MRPSPSQDGAPDALDPRRHSVTAWLFARVLGLCLVVAFLDLWRQAPGLIGERGIAPLAATLDALRAELGASAWWRAPTLLWLAPAGAAGLQFARALALVGLACGLLIAGGLVQRAACAIAFSCLLAFSALDQGGWFLFNWPYDQLLLETTFASIALVPWAFRARFVERREPPRVARWLLLWCAFRLFFGCGITKLLAGQSLWFDGSATYVFLETMPSPRPEASWLRAAPHWVHAASCYATFGYELVGPLLLFAPRRVRVPSALAGIALMALVMLVGNFRGLPVVSCLLLLVVIDDRAWACVLPRRWLGADTAPTPRAARANSWLAVAIAVPVLLASTSAFLTQLGLRTPAVDRIAAPATALRVGNAYSMFCIVPPRRATLVFEASQDGEHWREYQPLGHCARLDRAQTRHAPFHSFLGFALWLAGLSPPEFGARFLPAVQRGLLAGAPEIEALFDELPFDGARPRFVRCVRYVYGYASPEERARGVHWRREPRELVLAPREADVDAASDVGAHAPR